MIWLVCLVVIVVVPVGSWVGVLRLVIVKLLHRRIVGSRVQMELRMSLVGRRVVVSSFGIDSLVKPPAF